MTPMEQYEADKEFKRQVDIDLALILNNKSK